jgi:hypothetical protein
VLRLRGSSRVDWKPDRLCDTPTKLIVIFTRRKIGHPRSYQGDEDMDVFPSEIPPGLPPELPPDFRVSPTFNISDLKPYMGDEDEIESRTTPIQEEEDNEDITSIHTMNGPITRSRARQLNLQELWRGPARTWERPRC